MPASLASPEKAPAPTSWLLAVRPRTLPAALSPVLVGCAVAWAERGFDLITAVAAFAVALLLQIGANLANDVADFHRGADSAGRLGPVRVTQGGLIAPRQMTIATAVVLAAAMVPGLYLVWRGGPVLAALGLLAILAAVTYTAGPKPFGYLGLGEFFVFLFFGPVAVLGTAYAMMRVATPTGVMASIPMGCLVTAILVVNNVRDLDTDREVGKRTLAVRIGRDGSRWEYAVLMIVAYATPVMMWLSGTTGPWPIAAWVTAPLGLMLVRQVWIVTGRGLNAVLAGTARLCLWFAMAFSAGIVL